MSEVTAYRWYDIQEQRGLYDGSPEATFLRALFDYVVVDDNYTTELRLLQELRILLKGETDE
jgi:hypothetical protein